MRVNLDGVSRSVLSVRLDGVERNIVSMRLNGDEYIIPDEPVEADSLFDTFEGNTLDTSKWPYVSRPELISVSDGRLRMYMGSNQTGASYTEALTATDISMPAEGVVRVVRANNPPPGRDTRHGIRIQATKRPR